LNSNTYKIGKTAELAGVNRETIRYYERIQLISPPARRRSGYREFSQIHIDQIRFIKRAQELGFTLSEIKELLELKVSDDFTCSEIKEQAEVKYHEVISKIKDLKNIRNTLLNLIDSCSGDGPKGDCPILGALEGENESG